jgi:hypothetical protein
MVGDEMNSLYPQHTFPVMQMNHHWGRWDVTDYCSSRKKQFITGHEAKAHVIWGSAGTNPKEESLTLCGQNFFQLGYQLININFLNEVIMNDFIFCYKMIMQYCLLYTLTITLKSILRAYNVESN